MLLKLVQLPFFGVSCNWTAHTWCQHKGVVRQNAHQPATTKGCQCCSTNQLFTLAQDDQTQHAAVHWKNICHCKKRRNACQGGWSKKKKLLGVAWPNQPYTDSRPSRLLESLWHSWILVSSHQKGLCNWGDQNSRPGQWIPAWWVSWRWSPCLDPSHPWT